MKKSLIAAIISLAFLSGCIKDQCKSTNTYTFYKPVYKTTAEVRANIRSNSPRDIEQPGKLYIRGNYIFLNDIDKGIHVIDNSNPSNPSRVAFIDIPGNMDLAVKGNILYADLYTDLVAIDITNPLNVSLVKVVEGVFPRRYYASSFVQDSTKVIAAWEKRDTVVVEDCGGNWGTFEMDQGVFMTLASNGSGGAPSFASPVGMGGSMARFTITSNRLYTVGDSELDAFNIVDAANPQHTANKHIGWGIETIYPFKDNLFIGSTSGMFIFSIVNPDNPTQVGQFSHVRSCDPVIADDDYAYVTLRSGTECTGFTNQLDVLNINNIMSPTLLRTYPFTNPHGLAKDDDLLFICDGRDGLKVYDATNVMQLQHIKTIGGMETYDVIAFNNIVLVVAKDGLYQYNYANRNNITLLSKIAVNN